MVYLKVSGPIAQLARAPPLHGGGRRFESDCVHTFFNLTNAFCKALFCFMNIQRVQHIKLYIISVAFILFIAGVFIVDNAVVNNSRTGYVEEGCASNEQLTQEYSEAISILDKISVPDDLCIVISKNNIDAYVTGYYYPHFNVIELNELFFSTQPTSQGILVHELVHAWQDWYLDDQDVRSVLELDWENTPAGTEFVDIVGFTQVGDVWQLPVSSEYKYLYGGGSHLDNTSNALLGTHPIELSAEIITLFLIEDIDSSIINRGYSQLTVNSVTTNKTLRAWFEKWVLKQNIQNPVIEITQ